MPETLPKNVYAFLRECVESYEQLELLLFLREHAAVEWPMSEIADRMRFPAAEIDEAVRGLLAAGCIAARTQPQRTIRYAPRDEGQAEAIDAMAAAYAARPLAIIKLMNANAIERVRSAAMDTFADAFVLGRKKDG
jgi:hypothetical protein